MVDEKGAVITTVVAVVGVAFAGVVAYKILKKKGYLQKFGDKCRDTWDGIKDSFQKGYKGERIQALPS